MEEEIKSELTKIKLKGGAEVMIKFPLEYFKCKACRAKIIWGVTVKNGKFIPIRYVDNEFIAHFADCPKSDYFRKKPDDKK